jgi:hypothetical protein
MRAILTLLTTLTFTVSLAGAADAAACKDAKGKFTKCPAPAAASASYALDGRGNCHDAKGKMSKKSMCAAVATAMPATAAAVPASAREAASPMSTLLAGGPNCKKGKRCGNACISVKDVCHK